MSIKTQISKALDHGFEKSVNIHSNELDVDVDKLADQTSNLIMAAYSVLCAL